MEFWNQRYRDEILRPIVVPFITTITSCCSMIMHGPMLQGICTQFLEAENIPVLAWPAYSPDMSPIEHVWDALDRRIRQRVPVPVSINLIICCFLLKLCHFYFLFSETTLLSLTKWMGDQMWWPLFWSTTWVFQMAMHCLAVCLFPPLCFCCLKILCEDKSRGIQHNALQKCPKTGEMVKMHCFSIGRL